jgi:hypothetical protein
MLVEHVLVTGTGDGYAEHASEGAGWNGKRMGIYDKDGVVTGPFQVRNRSNNTGPGSVRKLSG